MPKLRILQQTVLAGKDVYPAKDKKSKSLVDASDADAKILIAHGQAEIVEQPESE